MNKVKEYFGRYALTGVFILLIGSLLLNFLQARTTGNFEGRAGVMDEILELANREEQFGDLVRVQDEMVAKFENLFSFLAANYYDVLDEYVAQNPESDESLSDLYGQMLELKYKLGLIEVNSFGEIPPEPAPIQ